MGLKKRSKKLNWWIENFGEKEGKKQYLSFLASQRKQRIEVIKTLSGVSMILKMIGK